MLEVPITAKILPLLLAGWVFITSPFTIEYPRGITDIFSPPLRTYVEVTDKIENFKITEIVETPNTGTERIMIWVNKTANDFDAIVVKRENAMIAYRGPDGKLWLRNINSQKGPLSEALPLDFIKEQYEITEITDYAAFKKQLTRAEAKIIEKWEYMREDLKSGKIKH